VLWIALTGAPWRDLPDPFGLWNSVFRALPPLDFEGGCFESLFEALSGDPDFEYAIIDGTIVRVHQHGTGAKGGLEIRPLAGGLTTKIVAMFDALGNLVRFVLLPGQRHDSVGVEPLIEGITFDAPLGDKAFDNDGLRAELDRRGASAIIPPKADRARQISCDFEAYKWRHLVENFFCDLKQFRRVATR
jgi:transposase